MSNNPLVSKAVLASVNISQWSARRLDRKITDEVNSSHGATDDAGRYNKLLLEKTALEPLQKVVSAARLRHIALTQPWLDTGQRILPTALYLDYTKEFRQFKSDFEREADRFYRDYPNHVEARRKALNGLFNNADYPSADEIRGKFRFDICVLNIPDADDFRATIDPQYIGDIKADIEARMQTALEEAMQEPLRRIGEVVGRMAERLRAYKPARGSHKVEGKFHDSLVENVRDLVDLLPAFNLTNDKALADLTRRMKVELCKVEPDTLRMDMNKREAVARSAESILAQVQAVMT